MLSRRGFRRATGRNLAAACDQTVTRASRAATPYSWRELTSHESADMAEKIVNGVDIPALGKSIHEFRHNPDLAQFRFRAHNRWLSRGGHSETKITEFYGAKQENDGRQFRMEADEPPILLGSDDGPNPVEHLLNALATCLTGAMVYHAAARGIRIEECESELTGEIDLRGFLGISDEVRRGYQRIHVRFRVKSDAPAEVLEECALYSPVFDVVTHGTQVDLSVETTPTERRPEQSRVEQPSMQS
jgi:uncharacterized OsmC-like protein